ncbi:MAG: AraC family transcriptional regulator [Cyclobacteriaceae bacterium]
MTWNVVFLILCSIGAIQSAFIGAYFLSSTKGKRISNILLGCLLLALAVRVAKSTLWLYDDNISDLIINIGFAGHLAIVPLLLLYIQSLKTTFKWHWLNLFHFIPASIVLGLSTYLNEFNFWYVGGYSALLYHSVIYLVLAGALIQKDWKSTWRTHHLSKWIIILSGLVALFCLAYFMNYEMRLTSYMTGPVIYSAIIYFISFYILKNHSLFFNEPKQKYSNIQIGKDELKSYQGKVENLVLHQEFYLKPDFTLGILSAETKIPKHILSHVFNMHLNQSFTDYTNGFRIDRAITLFEDPASNNLKISAIAYECGFNTLSAFNSAFKKKTGKTPSEYKRVMLQIDLD